MIPPHSYPSVRSSPRSVPGWGKGVTAVNTARRRATYPKTRGWRSLRGKAKVLEWRPSWCLGMATHQATQTRPLVSRDTTLDGNQPARSVCDTPPSSSYDDVAPGRRSRVLVAHGAAATPSGHPAIFSGGRLPPIGAGTYVRTVSSSPRIDGHGLVRRGKSSSSLVRPPPSTRWWTRRSQASPFRTRRCRAT